MDKVAILTCILGGFDTPVDPVEQDIPVTFHRYTDEDFPAIAGLTPRMQYRIPKLFGWEMFPGHDYYIWLDGSASLVRPDSAQWYLDQLGDADIAFFKHPFRQSIKQEVDHIEEHLQLGKPYITPRYKNGLHKEQLALIQKDEEYQDTSLYATTTFIYRNSPKVQYFMKQWWYYQSRYFTCDQVPLPWLLKSGGLDVATLGGRIYHNDYMKLVSSHR